MTGNEEPIRLERLLSAAVEDVFDAMTDPARMADWFSPVGRARWRRIRSSVAASTS